MDIDFERKNIHLQFSLCPNNYFSLVHAFEGIFPYIYILKEVYVCEWS